MDEVICITCCEDVQESECIYTDDGWVCGDCEGEDFVCTGWSTN